MKKLLTCLFFLGCLSLSTESILPQIEFDGIGNSSQLGLAVSGAGDFNGDGFDDILITSFANVPPVYLGGTANLIYVLFGSEDGFSKVNLSNLTSTQGITIGSANVSDIGPVSISSAGDVNRDGIDDIIIGTYSTTNKALLYYNGIAQVIFGSRNGLSNMNLTNLTSEQGFTIYEVGNRDDKFGLSVKGAGDINGDGIDDIIIGAPGASLFGKPGVGAAYVIYGRWRNHTDIYIQTMTKAQGFTIKGSRQQGYFGESVSGAGDVNGDGIDDVIIGASHIGANGTAYVIYGSRDVFSDINTDPLSSSKGFEIRGANAKDLLGNSVSRAGDVNGDGIDDIIIGDNWASMGESWDTGAAYVIYGNFRGFPNAVNLNNLPVSQGFKIFGAASARLGISVSDAGDFNRDGIDDILIGSLWAEPVKGVSSGAAYVIYGSRDGISDIDVTKLTSAQGIEIPGRDQGEHFGCSVSNAGDINGDGVDELIIGAEHANRRNLPWSGAAYIVSHFDNNVAFPDEILA